MKLSSLLSGRKTVFSIALGLVGLGSATAATVYDYVGFGVSGQYLYGFSSLTSISQLNTTALGFSGNHLATDATHNRLLFTASGSVTSLYAWDFTTSSVINLGEISWNNASDIKTSSGGAAFYNGAYYLMDDDRYEDDASSYGISKVTFKADGTVDQVVKPFGNKLTSIGGLGDIAISPTGTLYLHSSNRVLWSLNLNDPDATFVRITPLNQTVGTDAGQLFFDASGRLLSRSANHTSWIVIDPTTGLQLGAAIASGALHSFADLSDAPGTPTPVPEPSMVALVLLGGAGLLLRRRFARE